MAKKITTVSSKPSTKGRSGGGRGRSGADSKGSRTTTDHDEIRQWAEARGAKPACVRGTGGQGDAGMIRLDFPGYSGAESLQPIGWDEWFRQFDENDLALLYQETTAGGEPSNFSKLVSRTGVAPGSRGRGGRSGGGGGGRSKGGAASRSSAQTGGPRRPGSPTSTRTAGAAAKRSSGARKALPRAATAPGGQAPGGARRSGSGGTRRK